MFKFPVDPSQLTIGGGLEVAWNSLIASAKRWSPVVAVMALAQALPYVLVGTQSYTYTDPITNRVTWAPGVEDKLGLLLLSGLVLLVVSLVGGWLISAIAISGLRNKPLTSEWVISAGFKSIAAGILLALGFIVALIAAFIAFAVVAAIAGPLAIILLIAMAVGFVYLVVRLIFFTVAIFDGFGPISGPEESWSLSEKSVLRLFGWGLMAVVIELGFSIVNAIIAGLFDTTGISVVGVVVSSFITESGAVLVLFLMVALYESQRARRAYLNQWRSQPSQYGTPYAPYPGGPTAGGWGAQAPQYPGYPPQQYPPQPQYPGYPPQQPYPPQPGAPDQTPPTGQTPPPTGMWKGEDEGTHS